MPLPDSTYYQATAPRFDLPALVGDRHAEVAVLGAGFAGLAVARGLQDRGIHQVAVLEAHAVGHGASGRNGGFVFGGYSRDPARLLADWGPDTARNLYGWTRDAVALIRQRIDRFNIDCDRVEGGAWWVDWFNTPRSRRAMAAQAQLMAEHFGVRWDAIGPDEVRQGLATQRYGGALVERDAFHFHPLRYAQGLARAISGQGGAVHPHSPVLRIERQGGEWLLHTPQGRLRAPQLVVAGGGYLQRVLPRLERARLPIATYVLATEPLADHPVRTPAAVYDNRFAFDYYRRPPDGRLLWGGRISILERHPDRIAQLLKADLLKVYPQLAGARVDHAWGGLMSYATHQMPQLGRLSDGLWFAQAFGGHGVAPTTAAGELLAEAIAKGGALEPTWARYGLSPVFGRLGLLGAQAQYSWAELKDALHEALGGPLTTLTAPIRTTPRNPAMRDVVITGTGLYQPPHQISNAELVEAFNAYVDRFNAEHAADIAAGRQEPLAHSSVEFIEKASGIKNRYVMDKAGVLDPMRMYPRIPARPDDQWSVMAEMAVDAAKKACEQAGRSPSDIDAVYCAAANMQRAYPAMACEIQAALGAKGYGFDMNVACSSATFAIEQAVNAVRCGTAQCALVVNPEITSAHLEWRDRDCHFIFGDVCTAILIEPAESAVSTERWTVLGTQLATQYSNNIRNNFGFMNRCEDSTWTERDKTFRQEGRKVFKEVVPLAAAHIEAHLGKLGFEPQAVQRYWLHQANQGMNQFVIKKLVGADAGSAVAPIILDEWANTASAGSIIAFHEHRADMNAGDLGVICSFGAGYSIGSVIVRKQ